MSKREQNWGKYFAKELEQEPKNAWQMVGLALRLVLKTTVFIIAIAIKIIRGLHMGIRGALRKKNKNEPVHPFAFNQQHMQQMQQMQPYYPPQQYPQLEQPMQPAPMQRMPVQSPVSGLSVNMLNEVYGAIGYIRQELVGIQKIINNVNSAINDIYARLNAIEGVQPLPKQRNAFTKKK